MQIKTIEKTIKSKMNAWTETITDKELSLAVKDNLLVSGGSITSLLLNIEVNDYDIYIKDMDVLLKLVKYYTQNCHDVEILDGRCKKQLQDELEVRYHGTEEKDIFNAYSIALRTLKEDQIKLYFKSEKGGMKINESKKKEELNYEPVFFSPNAISLSNDIQVVIRFHGDNEQIHKTFDFVHATNYFTYKDGLVTNIKALEAILTKQLYYQGSLYPLTSIIRVKKFIKRNWNISAGELLKIMFQISELDLKNPDILEEQLIGVDVAYFGKLIEILRGVPQEKLTSKYLNTIIDKVFNSSEDNN
jgi:hypothetical protein